MKKIIEFFKNLLSSESDVSSKRFTGMLGFFLVLIFSFIYMLILNHQSQIINGILNLKDIPANVLTLLITFIYVSAALIGLGILDKIGGNKS